MAIIDLSGMVQGITLARYHSRKTVFSSFVFILQNTSMIGIDCSAGLWCIVRSLSCVIVAVREESREATVATNEAPSFLVIFTLIVDRSNSHPRVITGSEEQCPSKISGSLFGHERKGNREI